MPLRENDDAELQPRHGTTKSRQGQNLGSQRRVEQHAPSLLPSSELFLSAIELRFEKPEFAMASPDLALQPVYLDRRKPEDLALVILCGHHDESLAARVFPGILVQEAYPALLEVVCLDQARLRGDFNSMLILAAIETPNFIRYSTTASYSDAPASAPSSVGSIDPSLLISLQKEMLVMIIQKPIKVLFLSSNPSNTARLLLDEEIREISQRVRRGEYRKLFDIRQAPAVRATDLPYELMENSPEVVHFSGHGTTTGELLFVRDGDNAAHPIPGPTLARVFKQLREKVKCVVLNACFSDQQAQAIVESIPCVIGMSRGVPDTTAVAFAAGFYEALAFGKSIAVAFELRLTQIELTSGVDPQSSNIPKLLVRPGEDAAQIFLARPAEQVQDGPPKPWPAVPPESLGGTRTQKIGRVVSTGKNNTVRIGQYGDAGSRTEVQEVDEITGGGEGNQIAVEQGWPQK